MPDGDVKCGVGIVVVDGAAHQFIDMRMSLNLKKAGIAMLKITAQGGRGRMYRDTEDVFWSNYLFEVEAVCCGGGDVEEPFALSCWTHPIKTERAREMADKMHRHKDVCSRLHLGQFCRDGDTTRHV
ncbi:hypothetical protein KSC_024630 [Ktedonobacter sp. SOSP1-52]|nr:hypothetical protein KSC_024630 [Ktedonobacter sp. SOSP1-52]